MSFRRTAISLIAISTVTAGAVGVYLWKNFNSKGKLVQVVPKDVEWYYHFQLNQIEKKAPGKKPEFLDSVIGCLADLPVLKNLKDPSSLGIALHSDLVLFSNKLGWYVAFSLNSESRLKKYIHEKMPKGYTSNIITNKYCNFVSANNRNIFFAWKHKSCLFFIPKDTAIGNYNPDAALSLIFDDNRKESILDNKYVKLLYEKESDIVFYSSLENYPTFGVSVSESNAKFIHPAANHKRISPLWLFKKAGLKMTESAVNKYLGADNKITSYQYLNLTFKTLYQYLKPFTQ